MFCKLLLVGALLASSSLAAYPRYLLSGSAYPGAPNSCDYCGSGNIAAFDTGAGTNAAILTNGTDALYGQFDQTYWTFNNVSSVYSNLSSVYSLYMQPTAESKFENYGNVGINAGYTTSGFAEGDENGLLVWNNTDMANAGSYFALCRTLIPGYESAGVQAQIFWQSNEAPIEGTDDCIPLVIHGAYE